jgi:chemotaxis methyl-accepting protein methylase
MILEQYNSLYSPNSPDSSNQKLDYHIDAFDLNPDVIARAEQGVYRKNVLREDGSPFRYLIDRWGSFKGDQLELDSALREHIHFFQHNIMDTLPEDSYDIIFFRNAFIYFSPRSRVRVLSNLVSALREGAVLIMGVAETAGTDHPLLDELASGDLFYFRKSTPKPSCSPQGSMAAPIPPEPAEVPDPRKVPPQTPRPASPIDPEEI